MNIVFVASECFPYAKTGGLADVVGALPKFLGKNNKISIFLPLYKTVRDSFSSELEDVNLNVTIPIGDEVKTGKIYRCIHKNTKNVNVYFVQRDEYFDREQLYGNGPKDYEDNSSRFIFFQRAVLEGLQSLNIKPNIIHCHDWQSGLIPVYLKTLYSKSPQFVNTKSVFTIHNIAYQGVFWHWDMKLTGLDWALFNWQELEHFGKLNFLKAGIVFADKVTTVSGKYAEEIKTPEFGNGLENVLQEHSNKLEGIVNGIDYTFWHPETDNLISHNYSMKNIRNKSLCKKQLIKQLGIKYKKAPLLAIISRLAEQKGFDILINSLDELLKRNVQFVVLGTGDESYEKQLKNYGEKYKDDVSINIMYDNKLAHQIEAGADMFLMPSKFEPCGLNQLYSLKYGTVPIVRGTGGLYDTIVDANKESLKNNTATGFVFYNYNSSDFLSTINRALNLYNSKAKWNALRKNCMKQDWSWKSSAKKYMLMFESLLKKD